MTPSEQTQHTVKIFFEFIDTQLLISVHKVPFAVLRSPPNYSLTKSKLRFWRLRKSCNWHFLSRHMIS